MIQHRISGLIAATHTPFHADGSLNLSVIEKQAAHLQAAGVRAAFISGTTGESHSLSLEERRALTTRWMEVTRGSDLKVVVHVGANALGDAAALAAQAQELGAEAISALSPSYFKPRTVAALVDSCAQITASAPEIPFYFYDIPSFTGVSLPDAGVPLLGHGEAAHTGGRQVHQSRCHDVPTVPPSQWRSLYDPVGNG